MDEFYKRNKVWIGVGALALILLLGMMVCALGAMGVMFARSGQTHGPVPYVQPPAAEEGAVPLAPQHNYGPGPLAGGRYSHAGPFGFFSGVLGFLFKLAFFGLLLLLFLGLVKRIFWGPGPWSPNAWGPGHTARRSPAGHWPGRPHPMWGPWAGHDSSAPWEADEEPSAAEADPADSQGSEYSGPQE